MDSDWRCQSWRKTNLGHAYRVPTKKPESVNGSPLEFSMVRLDWSEKLRDQKPEQEEHGDGNDEAQKACDGCINLYAPLCRHGGSQRY